MTGEPSAKIYTLEHSPDRTPLYQAEIISDLSVKISDFHITADQVGLAPPPDDHTSAEIIHEFSTMVREWHGLPWGFPG
jgi:hypothetical protein